VIEELSRADGSVGWFAMIASDGGYYSAFLSDDAAQELYGADPDVVTAGFTDPAGRAQVVDGGYLVSGRWPFASGCEHASWLASGCLVVDHRGKPSSSDGRPHWRVMMLPADSCMIVDSWHATGLLGTGSHHYTATNVFVPARHTFSFVELPKRPGPLYAFPTMFRANMAGVPLGIARAAIDTIRTMASRDDAGGTRLRESPFVQAGLAHVEGLVGAARTFVLDVVGDLWLDLLKGAQPSPEQRARYRLGLVTAFTSSRDAVDLLYRLGGGASVYTENLLDCQFRDIVTACQHALVQPKSYMAIGRMLLGLDSEELLF
jgi:indole-3-acetate monooxygenase